jgi:hypothetical protein
MRNVPQGITILAALALLAGTTLAEKKERPERPEHHEGKERRERAECPKARAKEARRPAAPEHGSRHDEARGPHGRRPGGERGGPGRFVEQMLEPEMARKLGLEGAQVRRLKQGLARVQKQEETVREKVAAAGREQAELLMAKGKVDEAAIMKAVEKTGQLRTQMAKLRIRPILLVKQILTAEQIETAHKMMRERMQGGRRDGTTRRHEVAKDEWRLVKPLLPLFRKLCRELSRSLLLREPCRKLLRNSSRQGLRGSYSVIVHDKVHDPVQPPHSPKLSYLSAIRG